MPLATTQRSTELMEVDAESAQRAPKITILPLKFSKVLHLIRHGEGFHNVAGRMDRGLYKSWDYEDSHLTKHGWDQAHTLGEQIRSSPLQVDVVIVSPLTRALETAVGVFGHKTWTSDDKSPPLMIAQDDLDGKRAEHAAVSADHLPPFVSCELCREHLGVHPCDKRRAVSLYKKSFPAVDFSAISPEEDVLWDAVHRETQEEIQARGRVFLQWILQHPSTHIAVVSHSGFLHWMLQNLVTTDGSPHVLGELHRWFLNCELRSFVVSDTSV